mmetsp:Transcript_29825/g.60626  ORF Transcript_29825/g.60626 Transcript_29825/m.60626 type:complete len:150 (+) Transcript_29825:78-527(+)
MVDVWLGSLLGLGVSQELETLLNSQGLSHAAAPLQRAGVKTIEDLSQLEEWQIQKMDLPIVSKRKLQIEVDRARCQQFRPPPINPQLLQQPQPHQHLPSPSAPPADPSAAQEMSHKSQPSWAVARSVNNNGAGWLSQQTHPAAGTQLVL